MGVSAGIGVLVPFPFYYMLWTYPQSWVNLCGKGRDPSKVMALVSHFMKLIQFISLFSVSSLSWPLPLYFCPLFAFGCTSCLVNRELTSVRFGKNIPWVTEFPFGYIKDPQYVGSSMSLVACLSWVPLQYILLWSLGYLFMIHIESTENLATRAKPLS
ncbi:Phosphatidyl-N-methylethanolamine N-methyltransferase [Hibiscus syriacus]|uniref:Phosphatidyl-N-methylethanolamine N-methyltransferase n=1 Tax=Hibiscus syriacus TaxID=106335 RepID=A0A6A3AZ46_HIBSY|nr:Phosphatidyl-N-methylethanolamine N-methyltransferase [Hibiscus syriacus]